MKRILTERTIIVVLFVMAFVVFVFAQQEARKLEQRYINAASSVSSLIPSLPQTAEFEKPAQQPLIKELYP